MHDRELASNISYNWLSHLHIRQLSLEEGTLKSHVKYGKPAA